MAVKKPGFSNAVGSRNRRVNRFAQADGNREDRRHKEVSGVGIDYDTLPDPDEIGDTGNRLAQFEVDEVIESEGSTSNDGVDIVQSVAAANLGVDDALSAEAAGAQITVRSRNNKREYRI